MMTSEGVQPNSVRLGSLILILLSIVADCSAQLIKIANVQAQLLVQARVEIAAADVPVVVPYCGETDDGMYILCSGAAHLEVGGPSKWRRALPKWRGVVLGGIPPERWKATTLNPGRHQFFLLYFSQEFFGVRKGEPLRVVINGWKDVGSMRSTNPSVEAISEPFACP